MTTRKNPEHVDPHDRRLTDVPTLADVAASTYPEPSGLSRALQDGIAHAVRRREAEIARLGGYGARIRGTAPDGTMREGVLSAAPTADQCPRLKTDDGRYYVLGAYEVIAPSADATQEED